MNNPGQPDRPLMTAAVVIFLIILLVLCCCLSSLVNCWRSMVALLYDYFIGRFL